jgi:outer membrane immunogenic protein
MRSFLLASTAVVTFSAAAAAADLPARMPTKAPIAVMPFSWTGCYVGVHAGAGWAHSKFTDVAPTSFAAIAPNGEEIAVNSGAGFVGGGQVGCDYQFASNWVIGAAGDFSWANMEGETNDPFFAGKTVGVPLSLHSRTDFLASATGRVGYAWDRYLIYAKGGAAWSHDKYEVNNFNCTATIFVSCNTSASETRTGWVAGGGLEWAFAPSWSALIEYDHYGFGTRSLAFTDPAHANSPFFNGFNVKLNIDVVKVGLNYRFGGLLH